MTTIYRWYDDLQCSEEEYCAVDVVHGVYNLRASSCSMDVNLCERLGELAMFDVDLCRQL